MFIWDEAKRIANLKQRGIDFASVWDFDWETAVVRPDRRRDYGEPRFTAYGLIGARLYVLVFTPRSDLVRVISLRKANNREIGRYELES